MLKQSITYKTFDDVEVTEDFYFNFTKTEVIELNLSEGTNQTGLEGFIKKIMAEKDNREIFRLFKKIIMASYGQRSEDGKRFIKSEQLALEFSQTNAFDELIISLFDASKAAQFIEALVPKDMGQDLEQVLVKNEPSSSDTTDKRPAYQKENRDATPEEFMAMSTAEKGEAFRWKSQQR